MSGSFWVLWRRPCSPCASSSSGSPPNGLENLSSRWPSGSFPLRGGALLFIYALKRGDPVFIVGQGAGLFIYLRNVRLIYKEHQANKLMANAPVETQSGSNDTTAP